MRSASVTIFPLGTFREALGSEELEVEGVKNLGGLISLLCNRYGKPFDDLVKDSKTGELTPDLFLIVNGRGLCGSSTIEKFELEDGDKIHISYIVDGG